MREMLHAVAMTLIVTLAAVFTLVQLSDVDNAINHLGDDEPSVIQPVDSTTSGR